MVGKDSRRTFNVEVVGRRIVAISAVGIAIMMCITTVDVTRRYIFGVPIVGVLEVNELILVFVVFSGLAYCQHENGHLSVDLLVARLGVRGQPRVKFIALVVSVVFFAVIVFGVWLAAYRSTMAGEYSYGLIPFPKWPGKVIIAVGLTALWGQLCIDLYRAAELVILKRSSPD